MLRNVVRAGRACWTKMAAKQEDASLIALVTSRDGLEPLSQFSAVRAELDELLAKTCTQVGRRSVRVASACVPALSPKEQMEIPPLAFGDVLEGWCGRCFPGPIWERVIEARSRGDM